MNNAFQKTGKSLKNLFDKVDIDNSNQIDFDEFRSMFQKMNLKLTDKEVKDIFNSIDFDWSGKITYPEFIADFKKTVETDITTLINQEKERVEAERNGNNMSQTAYQTGRSNVTGVGSDGRSQYNTTIVGGMGRQTQEMQMQTRIAILEAREKQLGRKLETSLRVLNHA